MNEGDDHVGRTEELRTPQNMRAIFLRIWPSQMKVEQGVQYSSGVSERLKACQRSVHREGAVPWQVTAGPVERETNMDETTKRMSKRRSFKTAHNA